MRRIDGRQFDEVFPLRCLALLPLDFPTLGTLREEFWVKVLGAGELAGFPGGASWVKNFIEMYGIELWALDFKV
jgi:hypothetical protein